MSTEAMKLALEALGLYARTLAPTETQKKGMEAITALDEALAQPQQEPSGWQKIECPICGDMAIATDIPAAQPQQEPVAWMQLDEVHLSLWEDGYHTIPLYTSPPAQEFVCSTGLCHYRKPLTDEQVSAIWKAVPNQALYEAVMVFARAIEAAHGIKGDA